MYLDRVVNFDAALSRLRNLDVSRLDYRSGAQNYKDWLPAKHTQPEGQDTFCVSNNFSWYIRFFLCAVWTWQGPRLRVGPIDAVVSGGYQKIFPGNTARIPGSGR